MYTNVINEQKGVFSMANQVTGKPLQCHVLQNPAAFLF